MTARPIPSPDDPIRTEAAGWIVRRDRGLSAAESIEFELWLAADERHAQAMQRSARAWSLLDRMPETTAAEVLTTQTRRRSFWRRGVAIGSLAAAALLAIGIFAWTRPAPLASTETAAALTAPDAPRAHTLSDGSMVQLNTGGAVVEQFTAAERRVLLARGEAHFSVTKNLARPFVVRAGALDVRAVGTAFNINLGTASVDVVVTEGRVQLTNGSVAAPALDAGERAVLRNERGAATNAAALVVSRIDPAAMAQTLAWRQPLLRLGGATLAELAVEFERTTGRRLVLGDPSLAELRFGGRFRADDIEGFTHVLATHLDLDLEHAADGTFVLRKKK